MYRRGDLSHTSRTLRVLDELRGFRRGRRLSEIASELRVSERTIRRDLEDLRAAGFEIESLPIAGRAGARLVDKSYSMIPITKRERYTLLAIARMFDVLRGTPLWEDVASLTTKLEQRMSPEERAEHATFGERFAYIPDGGTKAYEGKEDVLDALLTGVLSRRVVRYAYRDVRGKVRHGHLAPYTMALYKHGLYVLGSRLRVPADGKAIPTGTPIGVHAVERFTDAEALRNAPFVVPADFRVADVLAGAFGIHAATTTTPPVRVIVGRARARANLASHADRRGARGWPRATRVHVREPAAGDLVGARVGTARACGRTTGARRRRDRRARSRARALLMQMQGVRVASARAPREHDRDRWLQGSARSREEARDGRAWRRAARALGEPQMPAFLIACSIILRSSMSARSGPSTRVSICCGA